MADASSDPGIDEPDGYPRDLAWDLQTREGVTVHLRPIRPDDASRLTEFHEHLSARSVYLRYFTVHTKLSEKELDRFTHVDYVDRLALIAEVDGRLVAVGRYERIPGTREAEVAFIVADDFQRQGIGTHLLDHLATAALANGITEFSAQTLAENRSMMDVFINSGFPVSSTTKYGTVSVRFPIDGPARGAPQRPEGPA